MYKTEGENACFPAAPESVSMAPFRAKSKNVIIKKQDLSESEQRLKTAPIMVNPLDPFGEYS